MAGEREKGDEGDTPKERREDRRGGGSERRKEELGLERQEVREKKMEGIEREEVVEGYGERRVGGALRGKAEEGKMEESGKRGGKVMERKGEKGSW